jgi:iron complex outermembrane recepter protein
MSGGASSIGSTFSAGWLGSQINPDWINQGLRDANQAERDIDRPGTTASFRFTDPLCDSGLTDANGNEYFTAGWDPRQRARLGDRSGSCNVDETEWSLINYEAERNSVAVSFDHTFENGTEFYSFGMWSDQKTIRGGSGYRGSFGSYSFLPSDGAYKPNRHGQAMELGAFASVFGMVQPTDITNNPADGINGGPNTGYSSGGQYAMDRPGADDDTTFTDTGNLQLGLRGKWEVGERVLDWDVGYSVGYSSVETKRRDFNRMNIHMAGVGLGGPNCVPNGRPDFDFLSYTGKGANAWNIFQNTSIFDYVFEGYYVQPHEPISYGLTSTNQGKDGCEFYNPMLSSLTNPNVANSPELMEWLTEVTAMKDKRNTQGVLDATVTGELFEMRGGTAAFAVGYQRRDRTATSHGSNLNLPGIQGIQGYDHTQILSGTGPGTGLPAVTGVPNLWGYVSNNMGGASNSLEYDLERSVDAVYAEFSLPFWDNVESQIAIRYENYGGNIGSEISPKLALSWRPIDTLLVRGSWSESFRAPNLGIIGAGLDASSTIYLDPLNAQVVRAGLLPATNENATLESTYTLGDPSPNVGNEYADTFSVGFLWTPGGRLEGLSVGADAWRFEVTDRVLPENGSGAVARQVTAFNLAAFNTDGSVNVNNYVLNSSLDVSSGLELFTPCNPTQIEADFGRDSNERLDCVVDQRLYQVAGVDESIPSDSRSLIQLKLAAQNAGQIIADGVDLKLGYNWDNDWGRFGAGVDFTYVRQYTITDVPGMENGLLDIGVNDAAGTTGDGNLVRSLPDRKGHITLNWRRDNQGVTLINRYIGSYKDLTYDLRIDEANPFVAGIMTEEIEEYYRWDVQYNYTHDWGNANLGTTRFSFGIIDLLDGDVPVRETGSLDYDAQVHDGRGRRFYLRALWQF